MIISVSNLEADYKGCTSMRPSFQERVKSLLLNSRNIDENSSGSSSRSSKSIGESKSTAESKSLGESSSSAPSPRKKENSSVSVLVNSLGSCFVQRGNSDISFEQVSATKANSLQSVKNVLMNTNHQSNPVPVFKISDLMKATNNFSPSLRIGQGGFGTVYKGKLNDGRLVAIKRAKRNVHDRQLSVDFCNEIVTLSNIDHLNLVKFIGYAEEGPEHILVVEYVANGNLREHLDGQYGGVLDLATRLDIAIDVAHALTYLHLYADQSIIHRDIKSTNILLTENFRAKVADFGFSRLGPTDFDGNHVSTQVKGTAGYLDPEYLRTYQLTQKSDVYSFGVLLVELLSARRPIDLKQATAEKLTIRWAFQMFIDGRGIEILDPKLERSSSICTMVEKILELAFQCTAPTKQERPSMKQVVEALWNVRKDYQSFWKKRSGILS